MWPFISSTPSDPAAPVDAAAPSGGILGYFKNPFGSAPATQPPAQPGAAAAGGRRHRTYRRKHKSKSKRRRAGRKSTRR